MVIQQILKKIQSKGRGYVFTPKDFLRLGSRAAVDQALSRLARSGKIRRLSRGLYDYPKTSPRLGTLSPAPVNVARAIARQTNSQVLTSGAQAANAFGLSTQVTAQPVFVTDGPGRRVQLGRQTIILRHVAARYFVKDRAANLAIQAMRHSGPGVLNRLLISKLSSALPSASKAVLKNAIGQVPGWMAAAIRQISDLPQSNHPIHGIGISGPIR